MVGAAKKIAGATDGSGEVKIGEVGAANHQGAAADQASVNGIADGMKEIVDAGGKDALKAGAAAGAAGGGNNAGAGKLFGGANGNDGGADDNDIGKAAAAVNAVSGEQILKAIVDAAGGGMNNSSEKIAAAIVLRGMAKDGKFSLANQNDAQKAKVKSVVHQRRW
ncbi:vls recombination cassette Vls8 (plasmid) [Borreliella burgdorferi 72a]|nr:vls recombination cassette Vls8 [Borreliella burgdorferi 72a]